MRAHSCYPPAPNLGGQRPVREWVKKPYAIDERVLLQGRKILAVYFI